MANFVAGIISLTLGVIMVSAVFIPQVKGVNTTALDFSASELALWGVVSLAGIIGIVYGAFAIFGLV